MVCEFMSYVGGMGVWVVCDDDGGCGCISV